MNKRLVSSCIALVASLTLLAPAAWSEDVTPEINGGSKAALFTFSGLATLGANAFNGGIGGKYYLMDMLALRGSLLFAFADQGILAPAAGGTAGDMNAFTIGLSVGGEYHLLKTRVSPYVGATLGFTSTSTSQKDAVANGGPAATTYENTVILGVTPGFNFNIAALGGVEFFIIKELSLSAEYRLGYSVTAPYDAKTTTAGNTQTVKSPVTSAIGIYSVGAFTLAFYF
jgi:hypothetical protein